jgi:hypothetical protein
LSITAGSWISAITRISPPQRGQANRIQEPTVRFWFRNYRQPDFYAFRLNQDEVDGLGQFKFKLILSNSNMEETPEEVEEGDYALLAAMHASTREVDDWTWQTFWWTPRPSVSRPARPRPSGRRPTSLCRGARSTCAPPTS